MDELLVGVVTQLKLRKNVASEKTNKDKVRFQTRLFSVCCSQLIGLFLDHELFRPSFEFQSGQT